MTMPRPKPIVLMVIDGFGVAPPADGNAVAESKMPNFHKYVESYPAMTVLASASAVGLAWARWATPRSDT